ncbi:MAG: hypothetical protein U0Q16_17715 [Bryobacteraceae bacterium]
MSAVILSLFALFQASLTWKDYQQRGEQKFVRNDIDGSIRDFDKAIELEPRLGPHNWQRGIALYYAGRYKDCARQFETHKTVNPEDVENAVWHFLCVARQKDAATARKGLININRDDRVPMMEVYSMFQGKSTPEKVLNVAAGNPNGIFYAHLYIGLYHEALGDAKASLEHIRKAAGEFYESHYMGDVAKIHLEHRK